MLGGKQKQMCSRHLYLDCLQAQRNHKRANWADWSYGAEIQHLRERDPNPLQHQQHWKTWSLSRSMFSQMPEACWHFHLVDSFLQHINSQQGRRVPRRPEPGNRATVTSIPSIATDFPRNLI